jgi:hypothetical protein
MCNRDQPDYAVRQTAEKLFDGQRAASSGRRESEAESGNNSAPISVNKKRKHDEIPVAVEKRQFSDRLEDLAIMKCLTCDAVMLHTGSQEWRLVFLY